MAENTGGVSFKTGIVTEAKPGFAKVQFPDLDDLISEWLPVLARKTLRDKDGHTLDVAEHVACVLDDRFEAGCVLGAIYSDEDHPPTTSPDVLRFQFFDGAYVEYDRSTGMLAIDAKGPVTLLASGPVAVTAPAVALNVGQVSISGDLAVGGTVHADGAIDSDDTITGRLVNR